MFLAVVQEGGFTRAAERLSVSQSAVSRQVGMLEKEVRGALLLRRGRRVTLTHTGEMLARVAAGIARQVENVRDEIAEVHEGRRGRLRLAGGMSVCMYILPPLLKCFREVFPGVDLRVTSGSSEAILAGLRARDIDLALLTLPIVEKDLRVVPVLKEEMVVVAAPGHALTRSGWLDPGELAPYPLILYEFGSRTREAVESFLRERNVAFDLAMETENAEIMKAMVSNEIGVTVLSYATVAEDVRRGRLSFARFRGRKVYRETGWVLMREGDPAPPVTEMLAMFEPMRAELTSPLPPEPGASGRTGKGSRPAPLKRPRKTVRRSTGGRARR